jgi:hypothetical protein
MQNHTRISTQITNRRIVVTELELKWRHTGLGSSTIALSVTYTHIGPKTFSGAVSAIRIWNGAGAANTPSNGRWVHRGRCAGAPMESLQWSRVFEREDAALLRIRPARLQSTTSRWDRSGTVNECRDSGAFRILPKRQYPVVSPATPRAGYDLWLGVLASSVETNCRAGAGIATRPDRTICFAGIFRP